MHSDIKTEVHYFYIYASSNVIDLGIIKKLWSHSEAQHIQYACAANFKGHYVRIFILIVYLYIQCTPLGFIFSHFGLHIL